jgi:3-oxoacyl-[acyl-carrier-protein] synthase II
MNMTRTGGSVPSPVAVTGCGTINALGRDVPAFWSRLVRGDCGIAPVTGLFGDAESVQVAAVPDPLPRVAVREPMSRTDHLALVAALEAVRTANLPADGASYRVAIVVGTTTGGIREVESDLMGARRGELPPRRRLRRIEKANTADILARRLRLCGPRFTVSAACASGAAAIAVAADLVRDGTVDAALAGGSDALACLTLSGFRSLRAVAPTVCRPFDRARNGLTLGEGAGFVVLERPAAAAARGAPILAELLAAAQTTDAHHLTAPSPDGAGAARAMRGALASCALPPTAIDHVNAHGTGTLSNDAAEASAVRASLGDHAAHCPVTSIKGAIGHTMGAAGAIEAIASIMTIREGIIPPTVGLREPDPDFRLDLVRDRPRDGARRVVLSNSFGFGGANVVLCLGAPGAR